MTGLVRDPDWAAFDAMPADVRRAFADAPYDLAFGDVAAQISLAERERRRPLSAREIAFAVTAIRDEYTFELEASAYALYGLEHPQARRVSIDCLRDLGLLATRIEMAAWRERSATPARRSHSSPGRNAA